MDRIARSLRQGIDLIDNVVEKGVAVNVLNMGKIDDTPTGKLIRNVMLSFAEFERDMIMQRIAEGKAVARLQPGYKEGRKEKYSKAQIDHAMKLLEESNSYRQVAEMTGISKSNKKVIVIVRGEKTMKTIQQIIRELDGKDIENAYFGAYPKDIFRITQHTDLSVEEYKNNISEKFQGFLERLKDMDTEIKDGEQGILFAYKCLDDTVFSGIDVGLVYTDELLNESDISKVNTYAYEYEWQKHALKFLVADTKLTQDNLMEVIVSFLDTVSFFGYQQENLEREVQRLEEAINEVKEHSDRLITNTTEDLFEELGLPIEEEYPEENDKKSAYMKAVNDYTNYCKKIELERVKESLLRSGSINISACNSFTEDKL